MADQEIKQEEEIVIVGAGIAGLAVALGLHRLGFKSLVLESSDCLRATGAALGTWTNGWQALDALGIGDSLRSQHVRLQALVANSCVAGVTMAEIPFTTKKPSGGVHEVRGLRRKVLLETLAKDLPSESIRLSSKVVAIEESGYFKVVHLADGATIKAKVLIGCDGVNSVVAKWLGLKKPSLVGRAAIRGFSVFEESHGFEHKFQQFMGEGIRYGVIPCDDTSIYWFVTFATTPQDKELQEEPEKRKQFALSNLGKVPDKIRNILERTKLEDVTYSPLGCRPPWQVLLGDISKDNVCVVGDAFHPTTPDLGQGACSALEDAVVLVRNLAKALTKGARKDHSYSEKEEFERIKESLRKYVKERKWRGCELVTTAYTIGAIQQSKNKVISFVRDKIFAPYMVKVILSKGNYECGQLKNEEKKYLLGVA